MNSTNPVAIRQSFSLTPRTLDEAMQYAKIIAESDFCPKDSKGKPGNVLIAIQYGSELGLSPMQALQNVSVINGRPCVWGDALLGLVKAHPSFLDIHETVENNIATCKVFRRNQDPVIRTFSESDARKAGLWGKSGTWTTYTQRMLQMRARGFALRDAFPDVLKGLNMREEVEDYDVKPAKRIQPKPALAAPVNESIEVVFNSNVDLKRDLELIANSETFDELREAYDVAQKYWRKRKDKEKLQQIIDAKEKRKLELDTIVTEWNEEINASTGEVIEHE